MRKHVFTLGLCLLLAGCAASSSAAPAAGSRAFRSEELAPGVLLFRPAEPALARTNSLVIAREDGVLVVDSQPSPEAARELLAAIESRLGKPVRYLVLTQPHAESSGGASAFPASALVIGSRGCRDALADAEYDIGMEMRARLGETQPWVEPPRRSPVLVLDAPTELDDPVNPVTLTPLARHVHSAGDLLVYLPRLDLVHVGDLLATDQNPFVGDADMGNWLALLNRLSRENPEILVPLRGPAADVVAVRKLRDALAWIRGQVELGFSRQLPWGRIGENVLATPELEERLSPTTSPSLLPLLIEAIVEEAALHRRKRGLESPPG